MIIRKDQAPVDRGTLALRAVGGTRGLTLLRSTEPLRIPLPRTPVNKGDFKGRSCLT